MKRHSDQPKAKAMTDSERTGKKLIHRADRAEGGWSGGAMVLGKLPVPGRPTILNTVGQGPIALAVGAGGGGLDIFTLIYPFSSFSLSLGDGPIKTEILSQRAVKPRTTNHRAEDTHMSGYHRTPSEPARQWYNTTVYPLRLDPGSSLQQHQPTHPEETVQACYC